MPERDSVLRPWTEAEQADYQLFLGEMERVISDPELAEFLAPGPDGEFFDLICESEGWMWRACRRLLSRLRNLPV